MHIKSLSLLNFKNYREADFEFSQYVNCLTGDNGSGKTNVLDAIYYLSFTKSYFNPLDKFNICHGESFFSMKGVFERDNLEDVIYCAVQEGKKKIFKRNEKPYSKLADHVGNYPAVIITPNDSEIIRDGSSERRKFVDGIISQYSREYLYKLMDYNRVVQQRNNLLKYFRSERTFNQESLDVWNFQLAELARYINEERKEFIDKFLPHFKNFYSQISGGTEEVDIVYASQMNDAEIEDLLENSIEKDRMVQRTTCGPHKDDLSFQIHEHPLKNTGSQGQQKSFLIALKLAQFQFLKESTSITPILLLDDVFDKIDDKRIGFLMDLVSQNSFGQIFISDTHPGRVSALFDKIGVEVREFKITEGRLEEVTDV